MSNEPEIDNLSDLSFLSNEQDSEEENKTDLLGSLSESLKLKVAQSMKDPDQTHPMVLRKNSVLKPRDAKF